MSSKAKLKFTADLLFGVQIIGAFFLGGSQFLRLLEATAGQLLSRLCLQEAFLGFHLWLAAGAYRAFPSRITRQTVWAYAVWLVFIGSNIVAVFLNGGYRWSQNDTRTTTLVLLSSILTLTAIKLRGATLQDPVVKSFVAILFKALPQFIMAIEIAQSGAAGVPAIAVIAGHITILGRIGQIWLAIREAGWDRNRMWLCVSESVNEISWIAASIVWFIVW